MVCDDAEIAGTDATAWAWSRQSMDTTCSRDVWLTSADESDDASLAKRKLQRTQRARSRLFSGRTPALSILPETQNNICYTFDFLLLGKAAEELRIGLGLELQEDVGMPCSTSGTKSYTIYADMPNTSRTLGSVYSHKSTKSSVGIIEPPSKLSIKELQSSLQKDPRFSTSSAAADPTPSASGKMVPVKSTSSSSVSKMLFGARKSNASSKSDKSSISMAKMAEINLHLSSGPSDEIHTFDSVIDASNSVAVFVVQWPFRLDTTKHRYSEQSIVTVPQEADSVAYLQDQLSLLTYYAQQYFFQPVSLRSSLNIMLLINAGGVFNSACSDTDVEGGLSLPQELLDFLTKYELECIQMPYGSDWRQFVAKIAARISASATDDELLCEDDTSRCHRFTNCLFAVGASLKVGMCGGLHSLFGRCSAKV